MTMPRKRRTAPLLMLTAAAMLVATSPALAHQGERHEPAATQAAPAAGQAAPGGADGTHDMSNMDMPVTEMAWPSGDEDGMMNGHTERPTTFVGRLIRWLGAWHPAVVHFPVALLLTVAFLEAAAAIRRKPIYNASSKILLALGVVSAFVAAPLGWAGAGLPTAEDEWALTIHRWLGSAIPFLFLLLWSLKRPAEHAAVRPSPPFYEGLLAVSVLIILAQAFLGAVVTHGAEHLAF